MNSTRHTTQKKPWLQKQAEAVHQDVACANAVPVAQGLRGPCSALPPKARSLGRSGVSCNRSTSHRRRDDMCIKQNAIERRPGPFVFVPPDHHAVPHKVLFTHRLVYASHRNPGFHVVVNLPVNPNLILGVCSRNLCAVQFVTPLCSHVHP